MRGFTLLEVMVALAIMAGVVLTIITSFNFHLSIVGRDREETTAVLLAREKMAIPGPLLEQTSLKGDFGAARPGMTWESETAPTPVPGLVKLTLTVLWDNARKRLSLVQYVAK